jgi:hypothetical protein
MHTHEPASRAILGYDKSPEPVALVRFQSGTLFHMKPLHKQKTIEQNLNDFPLK